VRILLFILACLLMQGCTHSQQSIVDTLDSTFFGAKDVTVSNQQIESLPYNTMYLRINDGQRIFVVLGYLENGQRKWLTQDKAMLVTKSGRLVKTVNLPDNLLDVSNQPQDPLLNARQLRNGATWTRTISWTEDQRYRSATVVSRFTSGGEDVLTIAGKRVRCLVWHETAHTDSPLRDWQNTFWVDAVSGQVRQGRQMLGAGVLPIDFTILKPATL